MMCISSSGKQTFLRGGLSLVNDRCRNLTESTRNSLGTRVFSNMAVYLLSNLLSTIRKFG